MKRIALVPDPPWPNKPEEWPSKQCEQMSSCPVWLMIVNHRGTIDKSNEDLERALNLTLPRSLVIFGRDCNPAADVARSRNVKVEVFEWSSEGPSLDEIDALADRLESHLDPTAALPPWVICKARQAVWRIRIRPLYLCLVAAIALIGFFASVLQIYAYYFDPVPAHVATPLPAPTMIIYQPEADASGIPFDADSPLPCVEQEMKLWAESATDISVRLGQDVRQYLLAKEGSNPIQVLEWEPQSSSTAPSMALTTPGTCTIILLRTPEPLANEAVHKLALDLDAVSTGELSKKVLLEWKDRGFTPLQRNSFGGRGLVEAEPTAHDTWAPAVAAVLQSVHPEASFRGASFVVLNADECKDEMK